MDSLRLAFLVPLKRPINPVTTVSRNQVIANLALSLIQKNHKVTIFGTSDSYLPGVELVGVVEKAFVDISPSENPFYTETAYITHATSQLLKRQKEFDLIHNHMYPEFLPLLAGSDFKIPVVTTIHSQITEEMALALSDTKRDTEIVVLSKAAKNKLRGLDSTVIYNGVNTNFFTYTDTKREYLLFVGRMSKAKDSHGQFIDPKGVGHAIELAQNTGKHLKIVGNVEDEEFFEKLIKPYLSSSIEFVGPVAKEQVITREEMRELFQGAKALLFPINWEEPFGLVMVEALSCGTPVIAFNRGSVAEVIKDGETGYIVDRKEGVRGLTRAIKKLQNLSLHEYQLMRQSCRVHVERNFTIARMAEEHEKLYKKVVEL